MSNQTIQWFSTSKTQAWQSQAHNLTQTQEQANLTITEEMYQLVEGFGGCFNELGYVALNHLESAEREQVLHSLFHPKGEHKFTICRLPIGASDYALEWYSHNETDGDVEMKHFSIERDQQYLIPFIREALKLNPDLKLFASPWSPPTWMKSPKAYNFGTLRWEKDILKAYALYFVKFVQAYREEGITIHQIHVQNEVIADQKFPSCVWTGEQLREFIRDYLGPAFEEHGLDTEIWLGTINAPDPWEELTKKVSTGFDEYAHTVLSDPEAYKYIKGVGYQWAGKNAIQRTVASYPELRYMQTENECGNGENSWDYAKYVYNLYQHYFTNGVNAYIYWNMVLEPRGKSTWGWEQNSMITVDPADRKPVLNPEYYVMKHFSHFVLPGARRIGLRGSWAGNAVAFQNTDGQRVLVIANPFHESRALNLSVGETTHLLKLEPESFNTIVIPS
ncbi:glycoside hydrolase family 30 protein [Paenibacillus peoriae]|uniref:glycoside hydrolase family 30 protein n=1 Tax=Paenibacillus peoriae TaxID=59893 RepID=UPI00026C66F3|nr:glycoside hydrolase family 30 protein [Paenibacillus peoriae]MEC0182388.1 glycoside hydrolase family 30 protein [Paenibacillus peoriae]